MLRPFIASALFVGMLVMPAFAQRVQLRPDPVGMKSDQSHKPLPGEESVPNPLDFLSGGKNAKNDIDLNKLKELLSKLPKDKQDPKQLEELFKKNPQLFNDPEFMKQLKNLVDSPDFAKNLQNQLGQMGQDGPVPKFNPDDIKNQLGDVVNNAKGPNLPDVPKVDPNQIPTPPKADNPLNDPANNEWVKWFSDKFGDEQATKDLIKELADAMKSNDMKGLFDEMPELKGKEWKEFGDWGKANFGSLKPGDLPDFKMGGSSSSGGGGSTFGGSGGSSSLGSGGGGGGFGLSEGAGTALLIVAGVVGALLMAFFFFRKWKVEQERLAALAAGKQGLDLSSIRTREELVAAFDAVTLDQIGEAATPWNHRVIADQFAEAQPANTEPANELAGLYEKARYAPEDEDLTPNEFADARRDLHVLAGANA